MTDREQHEYQGGPWPAVVDGPFLALVEPDAAWRVVDGLWQVATRGGDVLDALNVVTADGFTALPSFAVVRGDADGSLHAVLRGPVRLRLHGADGAQEVAAGEGAVWTEHRAVGVRGVEVVVDDVPEATWWPLVAGVVRAGGLRTGRTAGTAATPAEPVATTAEQPTVAPSEVIDVPTYVTHVPGDDLAAEPTAVVADPADPPAGPAEEAAAPTEPAVEPADQPAEQAAWTTAERDQPVADPADLPQDVVAAPVEPDPWAPPVDVTPAPAAPAADLPATPAADLPAAPVVDLPADAAPHDAAQHDPESAPTERLSDELQAAVWAELDAAQAGPDAEPTERMTDEMHLAVWGAEPLAPTAPLEGEPLAPTAPLDPEPAAEAVPDIPWWPLTSEGPAPVSPPVPDAEPAPVAEAEPEPAPVPAAPDAADDHDGMTILSSDLARLRDRLPAWSQDAAESPFPTSQPEPVPARMVLSTGLVVALDRPVLLGRAPQVSRVTNRELPRLVTVPSPNQDISRTHAEVRVEGEHVVVTDLESTNGVHVSRPGEGVRRLHPGEPSVVGPDEVVDLGDGVTFTVERGAS